MPKVVILGQQEFEVPAGTNLLKFLQEKKYDRNLPATCGGRGACSTCAVRVLKGGGEPSPGEKSLLKEKVQKRWRLSCQISVTEDLEVEVPGYEVAEALEIHPGMLADILDYCAENLPLEKIPSPQRITSKRLKDLSRRTQALLDGGGDPADFQILKDLLHYALRQDKVKEIPSKHPFTEKTIQMMVKVFSKRALSPKEVREDVLTYPYFLRVIATIFLFLLGGLSLYALLVDAPLGEAPGTALTPEAQKAPWYFSGVQGLMAIMPIVLGGVLLPILILLFLLALPYIEPYLEFWRRDKTKPPGRLLRERPVTVALFTLAILLWVWLTIFGVYLR